MRKFPSMLTYCSNDHYPQKIYCHSFTWRIYTYFYLYTVLPPILWPRPISIFASPGTVKWLSKLIFLWIMIMFMFLCISFYCRMYNYMYLCTNKGKNMTKITIKLIIPILIIHILQSAMSTQDWREYCTRLTLTLKGDSLDNMSTYIHPHALSHIFAFRPLGKKGLILTIPHCLVVSLPV